jgi:truncated hemoglobin YjbI
MSLMLAAMEEVDVPGPCREELTSFFTLTADFMRNAD